MWIWPAERRAEIFARIFFRLAAFPIELPALTERRTDIVPLAEHFLARASAAMGMPCPGLSTEAIRILEAHPWRGNVRELQHMMERASIMVENGDTIEAEHLYFSYPGDLERQAVRLGSRERS
jgi:transcriptional regulator with PAS, ATPase and Fis domain